MQKKLQFIIFASFILCLTKISYARSPMLYFIDKGNSTLNVCTIMNDTNLNNCRPLYTKQGINAVTVSPDGNIVFVSTSENKVYGCPREDDGSIPNCREQTSTFNDPQGMAFDRTHYLYVTNAGDSSISVCTFNKYGAIYDCDKVAKLDAPPTKMAISFDDKYAYIILPKINHIAICSIATDLRFRYCDYFPNPKPHEYLLSISADPLQENIYFLNTGSLHSGISCQLINQDHAQLIGPCGYNIIDPIFNSKMHRPGSAMDVVPSFNSERERLSFVAVGTGINYCYMKEYNYFCGHTSAQKYKNISSIAYAAD